MPGRCQQKSGVRFSKYRVSVSLCGDHVNCSGTLTSQVSNCLHGAGLAEAEANLGVKTSRDLATANFGRWVGG